MHKIKTVLRLAGLGLSQRQIAVSCQIGQATVSDYLRMSTAAGLKWPDIADWGEDRLRSALAPASIPAPSWRKTDDPDFAEIRREPQTHKHLTLQLLWEEYRQQQPNGYGYSRYCGLYRAWLKRQDVVLRHEHRAGEKLFVDYAGDTIPVHDPATGEVRAAAIFVAVLGASSYTYAEATWTQNLADWIGAHLRAFEFIGGTAEILVPDNLKSGVTRACRYEPDLNRTYEEMATHYGVAVIPARRMKPRDKAKVESGVLVVERWIMAALRKRKFFSLGEVNQAIAELLTGLNNRPFRKATGTRRSLFEALDKPALRTLPAERYQYVDTTKLATGPHTLSALATDSSNNTATSSPVSITISNSPPPSGTALITGFTTGPVRNNFPGSFGMKFTVGATPLNVTALGRIYVAGNTASHVVRLVRVSDGGDVPGGSVSITLPSGTAGQFAYASLASVVTLDANTSYYLLSDEVNGGDQFYDLGPVTTTNAASVDSGIVSWQGGGFTAVGPPNRSFVPVNLLYSNGTGVPPTVAITAPPAGATVSGNSVSVTATATAVGGLTISSVQFKVDDAALGAPVTTSPYSIALDTTKLKNGMHSLTAVATDSGNNSATSAAVNITVNNNPTVSITAPAPGATVSGSNVAVSASASGVTGLTIASVQFKVDNVALSAPVTTSPYSVVLDSTKLTNGAHSLVAVATDSANNTATSAAVSITVANTSTTVVITSPLAGATVSGNLTVTATATPGTGLTIASVQFKVDNINQGPPVTTSPHSIVLDTTTLNNGPHTLGATATDSANNTVTSSQVSITVGNGGAPSGTPLITDFTMGAVRNNFTGGFGMKFTVGATPLNVTALGRIYLAGNSGTHLLRLVRVSDGSDVPGGSVSITLPSGTAGQFAYAPLASPVTLDANASYYLLSDEVNGGDQFGDLGRVAATNAVSVDTGIVFWPGYGFMAVGPPNRSYVPVNLLYVPVP